MHQHGGYQRIQYTNLDAKQRYTPDLVEECYLVVGCRPGIEPEPRVPGQCAFYTGCRCISHRVIDGFNGCRIPACVHNTVGYSRAGHQVERIRL